MVLISTNKTPSNTQTFRSIEAVADYITAAPRRLAPLAPVKSLRLLDEQRDHQGIVPDTMRLQEGFEAGLFRLNRGNHLPRLLKFGTPRRLHRAVELRIFAVPP